MAATITKALDLDPAEVPNAKIARSLSDDMVDMVSVDSAANDNMPPNAVASEIGQKDNGNSGSMVAISIENEDNSDNVVNVHNFAEDDKENLVGDNVGSIALSQNVSNNEQNIERHSVKLSNCKYFTIKFGNCPK